jgi:metal-dependent hydrolase (beta-lactamase superfamily II)
MKKIFLGLKPEDITDIIISHRHRGPIDGVAKIE